MPEIRDNASESQYEIYVDEKLAGLMTYKLQGTTFIAIHTEVDDAYEGQGLGSQLVKRVLSDLRDAGLSLKPTCPFVKSYVERHPEYADLVEAAYNVETLRDALLVIHLLGMAALFGGAFVQIRDEVVVVNAAMLHGALTQVVSGILLVGVIEGQDDPIDHSKVAVKFAVALVIALLCWVNRRKESIPRGLFYAIIALTVANVCIAVFWR